MAKCRIVRLQALRLMQKLRIRETIDKVNKAIR